ncbi:MAG: PEP/pyruvate-binding domain-containing protein, partial [bacterium]|nr:PEP/pyruvate-binding domain-containing protein [bacterium]
RLALDLKKQVMGYISRDNEYLYGEMQATKPFQPSWKNLTRGSKFSAQFEREEGNVETTDLELRQAVDVIHASVTRYSLEKGINKLPVKDKDRFNQLRLHYGAKAANLVLLSELAEGINKLMSKNNLRLIVPEFQTIPVDLYQAWKNGENIDEALRPFYMWAQGLKSDDYWLQDNPPANDYMVRSSAVFSEDGTKLTGAGVYDSVKVASGSTFEEFREAVLRVYKSTDSPNAQSYRSENGIKDEEMGLVIQKYIPHYRLASGQSGFGYMNSHLAGVPDLMEIVTETSRNFVRRSELDFFLALNVMENDEAFAAVHHFPPDTGRIGLDLPIRVGQLAAIAERVWGSPIQVEFINEGPDVYFLQVRELPESSKTEASKIEFPKEPAAHSCASIGVGDIDLPVLDNKLDNREKTGVVVFSSNFMWTDNVSNMQHLPGKGVVIVADVNGASGHIQTLCAERGLICLFPDSNSKFDPSERVFRKLSGLKRLRIVSNGIEARVYKV